MTLELLLVLCGAALAQRSGPSFDGLKQGGILHGFETRAVYLNDADRAIGARFVHRKTGFTLDVLRIQSVPQGFIWVTSYPTSNMGEPHTQEHLLLGKGNMGRAVANLESMSLASSSAFTQQWRTCYDFYTSAGAEVFFQQFERRMDALLHPDYTDEEIRREVRNFGVTETPGEAGLRLEEKGTVYNEMVSSMDQPVSRIYRAMNLAMYGAEHPMSFSSGGLPEALRALRPEHIRSFHAATYHLANMGMVGSFPEEMELGATLERFNTMLNRLQGGAARLPVRTEADLPAPRPAPAGEVRVVEYPHKNAHQPGLVYFGWPAERRLDLTSHLLLELFLQNLAGDATTNLYRRFIDSRTREVDTGAKGVFAFLSPNPGHPVLIGLRDVSSSHITESGLKDLRRRVCEELARVAAWKDGSPEIGEFHGRLRSRILESRRNLAKFVNSPPGFGFRGTRATWIEHLEDLAREPGFRKSLTLKAELAAVEKLLADNRNIWRERLAEWKLLHREPYAAGTRANPALIEEAQKERAARLEAELTRLKSVYGVRGDQEALRRYRADYDKATAALEEAARAAAPPRFMDRPPLGLDDQLKYKVSALGNGVPLVASTFDSMTSATAGIALRLDGVGERQLLYLSALAPLVARVGVIENGKPVSYEQMTERLRHEILSLNAYVSANFRTGRVELVVRGAGNDAAESRRALEWMRLALYHPDWRPENLARIRDLLDQTLSTLRNTTQQPEERWVNAPAAAWRRQDSPLLLATNCFLTQAYNVHRLRWRLKEASDQARALAAAFLREAGALTGSRDELKAAVSAKAARTGEVVRPLATDAARDLEQLLADIPDASLAADWRFLCEQMRRDVMVKPAATLAELDAVRRQLLRTGGARLFVVGSRASQTTMGPGLTQLVAGLAQAPAARAEYTAARHIEARLRGREPKATRPVFVGLMNPNSQGGVLLLSAPSASYLDTDREKLLDYLAANQYSGHGAHGMFMKTWSAGLAYSNGVRPSPSAGRLNYYAERTPELPQTLRFVIGEVKKTRPDAAIAEYAIAEAFSEIRSAAGYEARGEAMANDLADGVTPEVVARFHQAILDLRRTPDLAGELHRRLERTYARVMPGLAGSVRNVEDGVYFVIGPEKQLAAWERYLKTVEGPDTALYRLYPRDFWLE